MENETESVDRNEKRGPERPKLDIGAERPRVDLLEVIEKVGAELSEIRRSHYELERRVSKYERIFEKIFQQEAAERLNPSSNPHGEACAQISPLEQLRNRLR